MKTLWEITAAEGMGADRDEWKSRFWGVDAQHAEERFWDHVLSELNADGNSVEVLSVVQVKRNGRVVRKEAAHV